MIIVPEKAGVLLKLPDRNRIAALIPRHQLVADDHLFVRHGVEETKVLRNLGIMVPSPMLSRYDWPGPTPFHHQRETSAFMTLHNRCFVFNDMGLGKTLSALWAADYLMREGLVRRAAVLTTMTCMEPTWQNELFRHLMHRTSIVVHGSRDTRLKAVREDVDFYITNHHALLVPGVMRRLFEREDLDLIIVDESAVLRNSRTKMFHEFHKLLQPRHKLWLLTGQPCPNGPMDAYSQALLVAPQNVPKYITRWQADTMIKVNQFKWVPKPDAMAKVFEVLQPAIRFDKDDCLDLPPVVYLDRKAELSPEQAKAYNQMRQHLRIIERNEPVTAVNAAVRLSKLLQICCGCVRTDLENYAEIACAPRLAAMLEAVEQSDSKAIVFVPYTGALRAVVKHLEANGLTVGMVDGSVTGNKRTEVLNAFDRSTHPQVLVANPKTAAHGLNLTVASTMVWFSPIHSLDIYRQACERMARPGQVNHMRIVHLGSNQVEWAVYKVLRTKEAAQTSLLELYKEEMNGVDLLSSVN